MSKEKECNGGYQTIWQVVFGFVGFAGVIITMIFGLLPHIKSVQDNLEKKMDNNFKDIKGDVCNVINRIDTLDKRVENDGKILKEHSNSIVYQGLVLDKLEKRNPLTKEELETIMNKTFNFKTYDLELKSNPTNTKIYPMTDKSNDISNIEDTFRVDSSKIKFYTKLDSTNTNLFTKNGK